MKNITITMPDPAEVQALTTLKDAIALLHRCTDKAVSVEESLWAQRRRTKESGYRPMFRGYGATIFVHDDVVVSSGRRSSISEAVAEVLKKAAASHDPLADAKRKLQAAGYSVYAPA